MLTPVPFTHVQILDWFWSSILETNSRVTLKANLDKCEETNRIRNFAVAGGLEQGEHKGRRYNDSDLYKVLEGAAYTLSIDPDAALRARCDEIIRKIASAQQEDGYLNTWITLTAPNERWGNIEWGHELYCAGHLIEAAIAYEQTTGNRTLLEVAIRLADCIDRDFGPGPGQRRKPPGHQEIELALVKLHLKTGEKRYLDLARFFLDQRGRCRERESYGAYSQDHLPVREQVTATGHAVRLMYQCCGVCDVAAITGDKTWRAPIAELWNDVVDRKMYITGGIGSSHLNEGFTEPYDLPNRIAYCETCASVGMALWAHRMFLADPHAHYLDVLERQLYNGFLAGVSLSGDLFFYDNPLSSYGDKKRVPWFDCSCCPTNVVRFLPSLGERVYAYDDRTVYVSLYIGSSATVPLPSGEISIRQSTNMPWKGAVRIEISTSGAQTFALKLRVPDWSSGAPAVCLNGQAHEVGSIQDGFFCINREWSAGDRVELEWCLETRRCYSHPKVRANVGRVALQRGPIVYCIEGVDHIDADVHDLALPKDAEIELVECDDISFHGVQLRAAAVQRKNADAPVVMTAVPYHFWNHRGEGDMVVWMHEYD